MKENTAAQQPISSRRAVSYRRQNAIGQAVVAATGPQDLWQASDQPSADFQPGQRGDELTTCGGFTSSAVSRRQGAVPGRRAPGTAAQP